MLRKFSIGVGQIISRNNIGFTEIARQYTINQEQVYGIATYDALFKYILSEEDIRPSFFQTFIPDLKIESSVRVDEHMNPLNELQILRNLLHKSKTAEKISSLDKESIIEVISKDGTKKVSKTLSELVSILLFRFDDIKRAFPKEKYNGTMDFVCKLNTGEFAMIEMQVLPEDFWDSRALAYVAAFYSSQLRTGGKWSDLKRVIGINILGDNGKRDHWNDSKDFVRHYKVQEQLNPEKRYLNGIELIQYSIKNAPTSLPNDKEKDDWITFFKRGHLMTEAQVNETIATDAVKKAFERAKIQNLPRVVKKAYDEEDLNFSKYSQITKSFFEEGLEEGIEKGRKEGKEEGIEEGIEKGIEKGRKEGIEEGIEKGRKEGIEKGRKEGKEEARKEERLLIAHQLVANGMHLEQVARMLGLKDDDLKIQ